MSWYTLAEAVTLGPSAQTWQQRIDAEEVDSYVDSRGRRLMWITSELRPATTAWHLEPELVPIWKDVASLRREVLDLRKRRAEPEPEFVAPLALKILKAEIPDPVFEWKAPPPEIELEPVEPEYAAPLALRIVTRPATETREDPAAILELVANSWTGSDRELERRAELPKAFLAKAKKGLRNGPRSAGSWTRLGAFMRAA